jgi:hypothetical protein
VLEARGRGEPDHAVRVQVERIAADRDVDVEAQLAPEVDRDG